MINAMLVYLRNSLRLVGLLMCAMGLGLSLYHCGVLLQTGAAPLWSLNNFVPVPRGLYHAAPLAQAFFGWPWIVCEEVPLPLGLLVGGLLALRV